MLTAAHVVGRAGTTVFDDVTDAPVGRVEMMDRDLDVGLVRIDEFVACTNHLRWASAGGALLLLAVVAPLADGRGALLWTEDQGVITLDWFSRLNDTFALYFAGRRLEPRGPARVSKGYSGSAVFTPDGEIIGMLRRGMHGSRVCEVVDAEQIFGALHVVLS